MPFACSHPRRDDSWQLRRRATRLNQTACSAPHMRSVPRTVQRALQKTDVTNPAHAAEFIDRFVMDRCDNRGRQPLGRPHRPGVQEPLSIEVRARDDVACVVFRSRIRAVSSELIPQRSADHLGRTYRHSRIVPAGTRNPSRAWSRFQSPDRTPYRPGRRIQCSAGAAHWRDPA